MPLIAGPALLTALLVLVDTVGLLFTIASLLVNLALVVVAFWNADLVRTLDGQTRVTRGVENSRAPAGRHRRQSDPPRVARRVSVANGSSAWILRVDDLADHDASLPTSSRVRNLSRNVRRWQYAVAREGQNSFSSALLSP